MKVNPLYKLLGKSHTAFFMPILGKSRTAFFMPIHFYITTRQLPTVLPFLPRDVSQFIRKDYYGKVKNYTLDELLMSCDIKLR
jgi:hypothetical protein